MPEAKQARALSKSRLVRELSRTCRLPQAKVRELMDSLLAIAKREARTAFVLPGLCKIEVVRRKPRKVRNPRTGETFTLPEREAVRITAPRSLKTAFAKPAAPAAPAEPAAPAAPPAGQPMGAEAPSPEKLKGLTLRIDVDALGLGGAPRPSEDPPQEAMVSFVCPACRQELEASRDMAGETTTCPNCGAPILVPGESASNTLHASPDADPSVVQAMKGRTMRIDMGEDF